ncbi:MAG: secretin N-terminal domain-containing protein [Blastocatellia bacterium]
MKLKAILWLIIPALLALPLTAAAQSNNEQKKPAQTAPVMPAEGLKTKMLEVRHRDSREVGQVLRGLLSGAPGTGISSSDEFKTLTVRDYPENIATIEEALKRLDVPAPPPPSKRSYEVQIYLVATSRNATEKTTLPAGLEPVMTQLQETLRYKGYRYITTFVNRVEESGSVSGKGITDPMFPLPADSGKCFYEYRADLLRIADEAGKDTLRLRNFAFRVKTPVALGQGNISYQDSGVNTDLSLREDEKVVVGTANLGVSDEAMIVVVSVRKLK